SSGRHCGGRCETECTCKRAATCLYTTRAGRGRTTFASRRAAGGFARALTAVVRGFAHTNGAAIGGAGGGEAERRFDAAANARKINGRGKVCHGRRNENPRLLPPHDLAVARRT